MRWPFALLLAAACGHTPHYSASYSYAHGAAQLPAHTSSGTTTSIKYIEDGGVVTNAILGIFIALSAVDKIDFGSPGGWVIDSQKQSGSSVETRYHWEQERPGSVTIDTGRAAEAQRLIDALADTYVPVQLTIELPLRDLGGDTTGFVMGMQVSGSPRSAGVLGMWYFSAGFAAGHETFHDRTRRHVIQTGDTLSAMETVEDIGYTYVGTPVKIVVNPHPVIGFYLQADLNWAAFAGKLFDDDEASPIRAGTELRLGPLLVRGEVAADVLRPDAVTLAVEGGLGF